jgi:predicted esterase
VQVSTSPTSANVSLSVSYSNVDWEFLKIVYGWAAVQYQAWARGELIIGGSRNQHVILHTDSILEYCVDDEHYFGGDFYKYRKAPPVLHLAPGTHKIELRLVRDVRASGGILEPTIDVVVDVQQVAGTLDLARPGILMSDVVDGRLAGPLGSVTLRNSGQQDVEIIGIHASNVSWPVSFRGLGTAEQSIFASQSKILTTDKSNVLSPNNTNSRIIVAAGQIRPMVFNVTLPSHNTSFVAYDVTYQILGRTHQSTLQVSQTLNYVSTYQPHKMTFLHPGGMLSYTMLRPPAKNATCRPCSTQLPVFLALHGAGLEADNTLVTSALDAVSDLCAWVLFPTGVTPWSGDDWHNWGFADVIAAIEAIPAWIEHIGWAGPGVDVHRWIVSGHSNGGQGTWYALTHFPDRVLAAAPGSGYASVQKYVSYELWQPADPRRTAIIGASLNSYRHVMLLANSRGIPIQQQHGELDDNVPAYNSRFLAEQIYLAGADSSYNEVPSQHHWWDAVMTTPELVDFYYTQAKNEDVLPRKLEQFSLVVSDPGDMGAKGGLRVISLEDPGQYGRVDVKGHRMRTSNVQALELDLLLWKDSIVVDGQELQLTAAIQVPGVPIRAHCLENTWTLEPYEEDSTLPRRHGRQLGSMTAILRSQGPFLIRHPGSVHTSRIALQISRNLHQYFQADTVILPSFDDHALLNSTGNIITVALNNSIPDYSSPFPIRVGNSSVSVRDYKGREHHYGDSARGAAFLRPAGGERLDLLIWGADEAGLRQAARIVPMLTGVGQPDFVVSGESVKWRGIEGALAMGFFDARWQVTASSVVETGWS